MSVTWVDDVVDGEVWQHCEGCSRWRWFPWPGGRVSRLCPPCLELAEKVLRRDAAAAELVRTVRGLWGLRKRLVHFLWPDRKR